MTYCWKLCLLSVVECLMHDVIVSFHDYHHSQLFTLNESGGFP